MSGSSSRYANEFGTQSLPERPSIDHLKHQAQDLITSGLEAKLSDAQYRIAMRYGYDSWPKLKKYVETLTLSGELKTAIDRGDYDHVRELMMKHPHLHQAPIGYNKNGPLTWVAECRIPRVAPSRERLALAEWMIENGTDVHQGGDGPLMRAALDDDRIAMMELLVKHGADVNALWNGHYPIIFAPCETLAPASLKWLLDHGADPDLHTERFGSPVAMLIATYARNAKGRAACLRVFVEAGNALPDTAPMALAQGRLDLLGALLKRDADLLSRHFAYDDVFPSVLGIKAGEGLTFTPLDGSTLLHQAVEFDDLESVVWLLENGADPSVRAGVDADGFGGQTPLHHTVVCGRKTDCARILLEHGANPNARATFRKQLADMGEPEKEGMFEFHDASPIAYARGYQAPEFVNEAAVEAIARAGGGI